MKKDGTVLYDPIDIEKYTVDEIGYQNRPPSLKRDYRPSDIAGTTNNLAYFRYHPEERAKAQVKCINDFITRFVSHRSSIAAYREAITKMDAYVVEGGIGALFSKDVNIDFINTIGGRPNSFNYRETWPKKVETILN